MKRTRFRFGEQPEGIDDGSVIAEMETRVRGADYGLVISMTEDGDLIGLMKQVPLECIASNASPAGGSNKITLRTVLQPETGSDASIRASPVVHR